MLEVAALLGALGCGLIAGTFFAFSTFVMKALGKLPPPEGIAAMQSINVTVINPWFMTPFLGTAAVCVLLTIALLLRWDHPGRVYMLVASTLYLVGTVLVTILFNVPRNNALAAVAPPSPEAARVWVDYLSTWTAWNHVRTAAAFVAAVQFMIALRIQG